jgi:hypothetical protein
VPPVNEQPFEEGNRMFNIGDNDYVLASYKDLVKGKTEVLKTAKGIVKLAANDKYGIKIVAGGVDLSKSVYSHNDNFDLINQYGMIDKDGYIQLSNVDLDGSGEKEFVVTIGAPGLCIASFFFTSELKYTDKLNGWRYMFLNRHRHIISPHSALRWYDYYSYKNGKIENLGEVDIDTISQRTDINISLEKGQEMLKNELRKTK